MIESFKILDMIFLEDEKTNRLRKLLYLKMKLSGAKNMGNIFSGMKETSNPKTAYMDQLASKAKTGFSSIYKIINKLFIIFNYSSKGYPNKVSTKKQFAD